MEIKILAPDDVEFKEKDIQRAIEKDLAKIQEGLEFVDSEVIIPVGRIDTLAFDTNTNQPVFIEYKAGEFGKEALIQLMDYLSWFIRDRSHYDTLKRLIKQKRPDIQDIEQDVRLICIVTNIEERVRNAIFALANDVTIYSYVVALDTGKNAILIPKIEVDNSEIERGPQISISEEDLVKKFPEHTAFFNTLKSELIKNGAESYVKGRAIRFRKHRVFALVFIRKGHVRLRLLAGMGNINDPDFKYARKGESNWGAVMLNPKNELPEKVKQWIETAREFVPSKAEDEDEIETSEEA